MKYLHCLRFVRLPLVGLVASREALSWNVEDTCLHVMLFGGLWCSLHMGCSFSSMLCLCEQ